MSVLQPWTDKLTMMQQSVLITATRGPDNIKKDHVAKLLIRWLRRCYLMSAMEKTILSDPGDPRGGSFTGPSIYMPIKKPSAKDWWCEPMNKVVIEYLRHVDELPHHFQLHFLHAAEILGYKHPDDTIRNWWLYTYLVLVRDMHLSPETVQDMDFRLGDNRDNWLKAEQVTAKHSTSP